MYTQPPKLILIQEKKNYQMQMCSAVEGKKAGQFSMLCFVVYD